MSREHRRAKTDRLDTELLMRAFLGWLRGERRHCSMAAIPTIEEEDAKRPNREREKLVGERTRTVNRIKATLARLGILPLKPTLRKAEERLAGLRTREGAPLPERKLSCAVTWCACVSSLYRSRKSSKNACASWRPALQRRRPLRR